jgi:ABC transporter DrrB family efflux protein
VSTVDRRSAVTAGRTGFDDPVRPGRLLADTWVMARRNLRRYVRLPQLLAFGLIQPIMFLLLFTYVFGGAISGDLPPAAGGEYLNFLLPGLLVQISTFGATQTAIGLTDDLAKGVIDRFRSLPMTRSAVLAGRTVADLVRSALIMVLMVTVAFVIGFRYQSTFAGFVAGTLIVLVFAYSLSWTMAAVGLKVVNPEATQTAVFLLVFPFVFASAVFVPVETMPGWLQAFAEHQPVTVTVEAARGLMLGEGALEPGQTVPGQVGLALVWSAGIFVVSALVAVRVYRRATKA